MMREFLDRLPRALEASSMVFILTLSGRIKNPRSVEVVTMDEDQWVEEEESLLKEAAYLTTGLLTAGRSISEAHAEGRNCGPHHAALDHLMSYINTEELALTVIENLVKVSSPMLDDSEVAEMVRSIVEDELSDE